MQSINQLGVWKAYFRYLQELREKNPQEFKKVPAVVQSLTEQSIDTLALPDIRALQAAKALPDVEPSSRSQDEILTAQAYVRALLRLRANPKEFAKVPATLQTFSEEEVNQLNSHHLEALKLLGAFPEGLFSKENSDNQLDKALDDFCKKNPELLKLVHEPAKLASHPKIVAFFARHPHFQRFLNQEIEKQSAAYLKFFGESIHGRWNASQSQGEHPYFEHPYGITQNNNSGNPFSLLGASIGNELGWLIGIL